MPRGMLADVPASSLRRGCPDVLCGPGPPRDGEGTRLLRLPRGYSVEPAWVNPASPKDSKPGRGRSSRSTWKNSTPYYFPKLRWWEKPETDDDEAGRDQSNCPLTIPVTGRQNSPGYRCGCKNKIPHCTECPPCPGNPEWSTWLMLTARGTGKTKAGANWTLEMALSKPGIVCRSMCPYFRGSARVCLEGESGIIAEAQLNNIEIKSHNKNRQEMELANGSKIVGASAEKPNSIPRLQLRLRLVEQSWR